MCVIPAWQERWKTCALLSSFFFFSLSLSFPFLFFPPSFIAFPLLLASDLSSPVFYPAKLVMGNVLVCVCSVWVSGRQVCGTRLSSCLPHLTLGHSPEGRGGKGQKVREM
mmetsp:Transcript_2113/g.4328  ORF Transcript_2113/g.4328 Transcript_2113/m.4328 type:complete len:110 (-) Transcript_2113:42-371(-)